MIVVLLMSAIVPLLALPFRDRERLPLRAAEMFGEEDDLADVIRVVRHLPLDGPEHAVALAADGDLALHVCGLQRLDGREQQLPRLVPLLHQLTARGGPRFELAVAMAVGLLAVGG